MGSTIDAALPASITAFAVTVSLGMFYPAMLPGLFFCAVSVALSRILLGMHFLSDVLAGAALGALCGAGSFACKPAFERAFF